MTTITRTSTNNQSEGLSEVEQSRRNGSNRESISTLNISMKAKSSSHTKAINMLIRSTKDNRNTVNIVFKTTLRVLTSTRLHQRSN